MDIQMTVWPGVKPLGSPTITAPITLPPPDPFQGMADFDIHPLAAENFALREAERVWRERAIRAECALAVADGLANLARRKASKKALMETLDLIADEIGKGMGWLR